MSPSQPVTSREVPAAQYELSCRIRPIERRLDVDATIALPPSDQERAAVRFALRDDTSQPEVEMLAPELCAGAADITAGPVPERIGWIAREAERFGEAHEEYDRALELAVHEDDQVVQLHWNMAETCRAQSELERARWAARNVVSADAARGVDGWRSARAREILKLSGP